MPVSERAREPIQKHLDALASEAEISELEALLTAEQEVADAFAEAARMDSLLEAHFREQYKIDQVVALLDVSEPSSAADSAPTQSASPPGVPAKMPASKDSVFVPGYVRPPRSRPTGVARILRATARRWKGIAAALLFAIGSAIWFSRSGNDDHSRLISGHATINGVETTRISEDASFEVTGKEAALIQLPGGARLELTTGTRARIHRDADRFIMRLESGGGTFSVQQDQMPLRIDTPVGTVSATGSRFSLDLLTTAPQLSSTSPMPLPALIVSVLHGTVAVSHGGEVSKLSSGDQHAFFNPT